MKRLDKVFLCIYNTDMINTEQGAIMTRKKRIEKDLEKYYNQLGGGYGSGRASCMVNRLEKELKIYKQTDKKINQKE